MHRLRIEKVPQEIQEPCVIVHRSVRSKRIVAVYEKMIAVMKFQCTVHFNWVIKHLYIQDQSCMRAKWVILKILRSFTHSPAYINLFWMKMHEHMQWSFFREVSFLSFKFEVFSFLNYCSHVSPFIRKWGFDHFFFFLIFACDKSPFCVATSNLCFGLQLTLPMGFKKGWIHHYLCSALTSA